MTQKERKAVSFIGPMIYLCVAVLFFLVPLGNEWKLRQLGSSFFGPDNLLNAGILEWGWFAISHFTYPFNWPAGYPLHFSLAGTESLLGWQLFYAPLRALGMNTAGAFNC